MFQSPNSLINEPFECNACMLCPPIDMRESQRTVGRDRALACRWQVTRQRLAGAIDQLSRN